MAPEHLEALAPLLTRRSTALLGDEPPTDAELDAILRAATTVPDHGGLRPWRLVVVRGAARAAFGDALAAAGKEVDPDLRVDVLDRLRHKALAAPALVAVVARVDPAAKVPAWEQVASASCAGYAITLAAHLLGLGTIWKSSPFQEGAALRAVLDMGPHDQFLGWVNLGHAEGSDRAVRTEASLGPVARVLTHDGVPAVYSGV
jgi:nitroreductase